MENYLRIFDTEADYESVKDDLEFPTVSYVKDVDTIYYMMKPELYEWVDLGLPSGLKWAAWNVGATKPEEFGLYFQWGETQGYAGITDTNQFEWEDYRWGLVVEWDVTMTKYNETDGLTTLEAADDAATATDNSCRMPTSSECQELIDNTTSEWVDDYNGTGVAGRVFTSNVNGNSIFVPAAGSCNNGEDGGGGWICYLWSRSLGNTTVLGAYNLYFDPDDVRVYRTYRSNGFTVRPVKE